MDININPTTVSTEMWHPIEGEWRHLSQVDDGDLRIYYTDGEEVRRECIGCNGVVLRG